MVMKIYAMCFIILIFSKVFADMPTDVQIKREINSQKSNKAKVVVLSEGVELELMHIQPGSFDMGSTNRFFDRERPVHRVTLGKPFWMGRTEVTIRQFSEYVRDSGEHNGVHYKHPYCPLDEKGDLFGGTIYGRYWDQSMIYVNWNVCMRFCNWLTERERSSERLPLGYEYRLPTEVEWEYCCRAGTTGDYAGELDSLAWYKDNSGGMTHRVGKKKPNDWGLYDMHGNVYEWCFDSYWDSLSWCDNNSEKAGRGPLRVSRGGSWISRDVECRSAFSCNYSPRFRDYDLGFRVVLAPQLVESEENIKGWKWKDK